jgi:hypothetical protein
MLAELLCDRCGYDLRAHSRDGKCPECGMSVAESRRLAASPRRPAWRDSDPRWRRRMLAGAWILVLLPLVETVQMFRWASSVRVPNVFELPGGIPLNETLLCYEGVYLPLLFCMGVVLLFSKERGRRPGPFDWTRRWGVLCSYVVFLLSAAGVLFIFAYVMTAIGSLFMSLPPKYQPGVTRLLVEVSTAYLRYGAYPHDGSAGVLVAFSSIAILLACVPLWDALRSSGPKRLATILLAPLALFSLMHLAKAGLYCLGSRSVTLRDIYDLGVYFRPMQLVRPIASLSAGLNMSGSVFSAFLVEAAKWCIVLAIAVWLSIAQLATWRQDRKADAA